MSRGLGTVQRFVLDELARRREMDPWQRWLSARVLADLLPDGDGGHSDVETIRRAIKTLHGRGLVQADRRWRDVPATTDRRRSYMPVTRWTLCAREPLSEDDRAREAAYLARYGISVDQSAHGCGKSTLTRGAP